LLSQLVNLSFEFDVLLNHLLPIRSVVVVFLRQVTFVSINGRLNEVLFIIFLFGGQLNGCGLQLDIDSERMILIIIKVRFVLLLARLSQTLFHNISYICLVSQ
jgi:hypothetical protein